MPEEFEGGNQTTIEPVNEAPIQQEQTEPSPPQESQYFEVKYNKEPVKVSYDEAPTYIQKGLNYDKVQSQVETYQQQLDRTARLSGYENHEQLLSALDEIEQQQERERYEQAGIDPEKFQQLVSQLPEIQQFRQLQQQQAETQQLQTEANELFAEFPGLTPEQIPAEAWQLKESRGLSLLDSYLRTTYKSLGQQKEQEAIQKLQQNNLSSTGSLAGGDVQHNKSISQMSKTEFESLQERVLRGEKIKF